MPANHETSTFKSSGSLSDLSGVREVYNDDIMQAKTNPSYPGVVATRANITPSIIIPIPPGPSHLERDLAVLQEFFLSGDPVFAQFQNELDPVTMQAIDAEMRGIRRKLGIFIPCGPEGVLYLPSFCIVGG
ncbi:hypothetical protein BC938DRAFT_479595 [Jimgerdemannia flammicorona]|uniref:Uncharacterized protein n=1 Tax=Jimgerdemannia flammicorona TaxID=994334 RepID=A0A433QKH8_9FUNG|nr:hypothetical protein BC938DRAFT_479595 [Jimgerdemannia flammicorona]